MTRKRTTVSQLAREAGIDVDDALIALWDSQFPYLTNGNDVLPKRDANRARRALGLATRRELATPEYWQEALGLSRARLDELLSSLGVKHPYEGSRLQKKSIHRLQGELRQITQIRADAKADVRSTDEFPAFVWEAIGHERELRFLAVEEVERVHTTLVEDFRSAADPIEPAGVRSANLLASALTRPQTAIGDVWKYPTVEMAAAALFHSLVHDHPFHNGNKRTALVAMLVFLDENGIMLTCDEDDLFKVVLLVAQHNLVEAHRRDLADREVLAIARWLKDHSRLVEKGERTIVWRKLQQILTAYDCRCEFEGSKVTIRRRVLRKSKFLPFLASEREYRSQTHFSGNGREIGKAALTRLRSDLKLDEESGVDSRAFYEHESISTSEFIAKYRKTLNRLSRV